MTEALPDAVPSEDPSHAVAVDHVPAVLVPTPRVLDPSPSSRSSGDHVTPRPPASLSGAPSSALPSARMPSARIPPSSLPSARAPLPATAPESVDPNAALAYEFRDACDNCGIMLDVGAHIPRVLPCGHTACSACLVVRPVASPQSPLASAGASASAMSSPATPASRGGSVVCPFCDGTFPTIGSHVSSLAINYAWLDALAEAEQEADGGTLPSSEPSSVNAQSPRSPHAPPHSSRPRSAVVALCECSAEPHPATTRCLDCDDDMCEATAAVHARLKNSKGHQLVRIYLS